MASRREKELNIRPSGRGELMRILRKIEALPHHDAAAAVTDDQLSILFLDRVIYLLKIYPELKQRRALMPAMRDSLNTITAIESYTDRFLGIWVKNIENENHHRHELRTPQAVPQPIEESRLYTRVPDTPYDLMSVEEVMACF